MRRNSASLTFGGVVTMPRLAFCRPPHRRFGWYNMRSWEQMPRAKTDNAVDKYVGSRLRMRRNMMGISQEKLGDALGLTFQQVQKYEKGANRISASRLQHLSQILQVTVPFFFEGSPGATTGTAESASYVTEFLATSDGLVLAKAFSRIGDAKLRRVIVHLVEDCAKL
jgi:transcriptional regulator with XRE-family HTH domain